MGSCQRVPKRRKGICISENANINNRYQIIKAIIAALFQKCGEEYQRRKSLIWEDREESAIFREVNSLGLAAKCMIRKSRGTSILKKGGELDQIERIRIKKHPDVGTRCVPQLK
jgi:hypothetical protein